MREAFFDKSNEIQNTLLQSVINARWDEVKDIIKQHPDAMFLKASAIGIDGEMVTKTPLEYAFFVADLYSQEIFITAAQENNLVNEYIKQASGQKDFFDLSTYLNEIQSISNTKTSYYYQINEEPILEKICNLQQCHIPRHLLNELCTEPRFSLSDFQFEKLGCGGNVLHKYMENQKNTKLELALVRGKSLNVTEVKRFSQHLVTLLHTDADKISELFQIRLKQQGESLKDLKSQNKKCNLF
ncbi:MAG: hypothetical protein HYX60_03080 [Legionella longbeachae]|nr:hypothetical protein [Legionella longbeachae]